MEILQIREAKARFSALVAAAEKGRPTLVSRHGQPCAMIVSVADGARLYPLDMPNLRLLDPQGILNGTSDQAKDHFGCGFGVAKPMVGQVG